MVCGPCHWALCPLGPPAFEQGSERPSWLYNIPASGWTAPCVPIRSLEKSFVSPWPVTITQRFIFKTSVNMGRARPAGGCVPPPEEHPSSGWLLLGALVIFALPEVSSDLLQAAVFPTPPAWTAARPHARVTRPHSPCLLATLPCIRSPGPALPQYPGARFPASSGVQPCPPYPRLACCGVPCPAGTGLGREGQLLRLFAASGSCTAQTGLHLDRKAEFVAEAPWFGVARRVRLNSLSPGVDSSAFPGRHGWAWRRGAARSDGGGASPALSLDTEVAATSPLHP